MLFLGGIYAVVLGALAIGATGLLWAGVTKRSSHGRAFGAIFPLGLLGLLATTLFGLLAMA